jgi:arsenite methyltransferase
MSAPCMLIHLILERLSRRDLPRIPEPNPLMLDPLQNDAFMDAGREDGILAFLYFYNALQITPIVRQGDHVLDLACGPANQLVQIARINPQAHFVGLDASANMREKANVTLARYGVDNVELVSGDMTRLADFDDASMDCVICTMSLHHLPDLDALSATMSEARRVLKSSGGIYFVDFGRFKRFGTQKFFAEEWRDRQPELFTMDYLHSLKAAFSEEEMTTSVSIFGSKVIRYSTPLAPFMVVFKSEKRRELGDGTIHLVQELYGKMTRAQQRDFKNIARWFALGGLVLPCAIG